jgi:hypothetical protein
MSEKSKLRTLGLNTCTYVCIHMYVHMYTCMYVYRVSTYIPAYIIKLANNHAYIPLLCIRTKIGPRGDGAMQHDRVILQRVQ